MYRTGTRRRQAHAELAGKLRVRASHKRGHLFVARLYEFETFAGTIEGS
jgi:hypothetical protein